MAKKAPSKRAKEPVQTPPNVGYKFVDRFWFYKVEPHVLEIWHNPSPRKLKSPPTKQIGAAYYRPNAKQWGAFVWINPKKPTRFVGMHDTDEDLGEWLYYNYDKLKK